MPTKWLSSYSIAPMTPRDAKLVSAHPNLMYAIKQGGDISKGVVKDYLMSISTRVRKVSKFADPSTSPTWLYTTPKITVSGYDANALALRLAGLDYPPSDISSVTINNKVPFTWHEFLTRYYKSKAAIGYHSPANLNGTNDEWESISGYPGVYSPTQGNTDPNSTTYIYQYGFYFEVTIYTEEQVATTTTDNSTTPPTTTTTYSTVYHPVTLSTEDVVITPTGSSDTELVPGPHQPPSKSIAGSYKEHFHDPNYPPEEIHTKYSDGSDFDWDYVDVTINFTNGKSTRTYYDKVYWDSEALNETPITNTLPDHTLPIVPIRLNKRNISDSTLKTNPIAKSIRSACRRLQMSPKAILDSITKSSGLSLQQCAEQVDTEIAEELVANAYNPNYTPPTISERQQRIDDLYQEEKTNTLENKNDIFIAFMTSLGTKNVWEKELLYWTFDRYRLDSATMLTVSPGISTPSIKCEIPDLYYEFRFSEVKKTTNVTIANDPFMPVDELVDNDYAIVINASQPAVTMIEYGTYVEVDYLVQESNDRILLYHKEDDGSITSLEVFKFSTNLGTPKDLQTWDGTLPTVADEYLWANNSVDDKTGNARVTAIEKHCIPIHKEVLEARSNILPTDNSIVKTHKRKLRKRCYEYGACLIVVELKKIHIPWWKEWVEAITFFISAAIKIYAIVNFWNPTGWTASTVLNYAIETAISYTVDLVITAVVEELIKLLPSDIAMIFAVVLVIAKSGIIGDGFNNVSSIEFAIELVDATATGVNLVLSEENKLIAKLDKETNDKIKELEKDLERLRQHLKELNPNAYDNSMSEDSGVNQFNDETDPFRFITEERYYGDTSALYETPQQFLQRTLHTPNPGLISINASSLNNVLLLDPTADMDLGVI